MSESASCRSRSGSVTLLSSFSSLSLAMIGTHLALCRPFHALWTPNVPGAVCLNRTMVYYAQLSLTIVMDFGVLVAPLFILRHLSLPWIQKLMILVVLSFGGMYVTPICHALSHTSNLTSSPIGPASSPSSSFSRLSSPPSPKTAHTARSEARCTV